MPFETHELDAIKREVADTIMAELGKPQVNPADLGLKVLEAIDRGAALDIRPFREGARVVNTMATNGRLAGVVLKRVEQDGELHTILVRYDGTPGAVPESPSYMVEVPA